MGEPVPHLGDDFFTHIFSGDLQLVHAGDTDLHERSLITGELTPLFEESNWAYAEATAIDERDIFLNAYEGIVRFDRATRELSLFAPHPEPEDPAVPADGPKYGSAMAISEAHLAAVMRDRRASNLEAEIDEAYVVAIIERAGGERRLIPVERPTTGEIRLYAHGDRFFDVHSVDTNPDPNRESRAGEIYAYDVESGTPEPFLDSLLAFDEHGIKFWQDSMLATVRGEGDVHWSLVRVPISGGEPEVIATDVDEASFAVSGNEAFVLLADETNANDRLTAIDLTNGETRAIGSCHATPVHGSDDYIYAHYVDAGNLRIRRMTP